MKKTILSALIVLCCFLCLIFVSCNKQNSTIPEIELLNNELQNYNDIQYNLYNFRVLYKESYFKKGYNFITIRIKEHNSPNSFLFLDEKQYEFQPIIGLSSTTSNGMDVYSIAPNTYIYFSYKINFEEYTLDPFTFDIMTDKDGTILDTYTINLKGTFKNNFN